MIVHPCTNLFDCLYPQLEDHEEEIIYQHPIYPDIKCNQIGVLYYDESKYATGVNHGIPSLRTIKSNNNKFIGSKWRMCWECYHGKEAPSLVNLWDFNPYNCTKENLYLTKEIPKNEYQYRLHLRKKFAAKTIEKLEAFAARHDHMTIDEIKAHFQLPVFLVSGWDSYRAGRRVKYQPVKSLGSLGKCHTPSKPDDEERVKTMFYANLYLREIAEAMDWGSTSRVRTIVKKNGWKRENPRWKK